MKYSRLYVILLHLVLSAKSVYNVWPGLIAPHAALPQTLSPPTGPSPAIPIVHILELWSLSRGGLVGYDAALTQLRSWVQFPLLVKQMVIVNGELWRIFTPMLTFTTNIRYLIRRVKIHFKSSFCWYLQQSADEPISYVFVRSRYEPCWVKTSCDA